MIRGTTALLAHIGWPTHAFKAPLIYNPYFEQAGNRRGGRADGLPRRDYPAFLRAVFTLENIRGALITMPHKVSTVGLARRAIAGGARSPARATRSAARPTAAWSATCSTARASFAACAATAASSTARARSSSAPAASARRSRRRSRPPAWRRSRVFDARAGSGRSARRPAAGAPPGARGPNRVRTTRPASTSSSTPRRSG